MNWTYIAGGSLALWLLPQGFTLAHVTENLPSPGAVADSPAALGEPETHSHPPSPDNSLSPLPWADLLDGDAQQPLRVSDYNRTMNTLWASLQEQRTLRSNRIAAACDALGSDMRYLRGRVPRQIEDAHRQMAPFQTKELTAGFSLDSFDTGAKSSDWLAEVMGGDAYTEAEAILELVRSGEDSHLYETYKQLFSHFLNLNLDDYLDPAQDDVPLSRSEFVGYVETLYQEWQDPTGSLAQQERFLEESDRLIQDLLTMLREVRRSLATLESTKAHSSLSSTATPKQTITPTALPSSQSTRHVAQSVAPTINLDEGEFITRRVFLLTMLDLLSSLELSLSQYILWCGDYRIEYSINPAQEMEQEVAGLIRDLDLLNFEILELVNTRLR